MRQKLPIFPHCAYVTNIPDWLHWGVCRGASMSSSPDPRRCTGCLMPLILPDPPDPNPPCPPPSRILRFRLATMTGCGMVTAVAVVLVWIWLVKCIELRKENRSGSWWCWAGCWCGSTPCCSVGSLKCLWPETLLASLLISELVAIVKFSII